MEGCLACAVGEGEGHEFGIGHGVAGEIGAHQRLVGRKGFEGEDAGARKSPGIAHGILALAGPDVTDHQRLIAAEQPAELALRDARLGEVGGDVRGLERSAHVRSGRCG
jgi:hypothetical protein